MLGTNPKRPPLKNHDGQTLDVVEIFPTIQGEGPFAGTPAIFIRLGGCNLACDFCDTEFETFQPLTLEDVLKTVDSYNSAHAYKLVVVTGGEPLRHNIIPLCNKLIEKNMQVQIETNGTLYQELPEAVNIVCSPKNTGSAYAEIRPDLLAQIDALKFIVSATHPHYQDVAKWCHSNDNLPAIYVQPMDEQDEEKNQINKRYAMELAKNHGYLLSLQLHKILQIP